MNQRGCEAVGIDLGTTFSSLAYVDPQAVPRIVPTSEGKAVVPSVVFFDDQEIIVGDVAVQNAKLHSDRVVQFVKVHMGDEWRFQFKDQVHTPESISAIILAHLIREAEPQIGPTPTAVITVPAYFTEKRRRATQQAGEIAGLTVIGTLNEPMSAALAYGLHRETKEQKVLVYDLGGGTFDVTIVRITPNALEELAICGNRQLGGKDWDQCLIDLVVDDFKKKQGIDLRHEKSPDALQALQDLQITTEAAKRQLSQRQKTEIRVHALGKDHRLEVTRQQFEEATAHLLNSTRLTTEIAIEDAKLRWDQITRVVLVGGSTLMPSVREMLKDISGKPPDTGINPVTAVALGAALYAQILETGKGPKQVLQKPPQPAPAGSKAPPVPAAKGPPAAPGKAPPAPPPTLPSVQTVPTVRFATAHGVGVKATNKQGRPVNAVVIPKNTQVPIRTTRQFVTRKVGNQPTDRLRITVTQGDTPDLDLAEILGTAVITGIPPNDPPGQQVKINMAFDTQGRLHLHAIYVRTNRQLKLDLDIPGGLRQSEVQRYRKQMEASGLISRSMADIPVVEAVEDDDLPTIEPVG